MCSVDIHAAHADLNTDSFMTKIIQNKRVYGALVMCKLDVGFWNPSSVCQ